MTPSAGGDGAGALLGKEGAAPMLPKNHTASPVGLQRARAAGAQSGRGGAWGRGSRHRNACNPECASFWGVDILLFCFSPFPLFSGKPFRNVQAQLGSGRGGPLGSPRPQSLWRPLCWASKEAPASVWFSGHLGKLLAASHQKAGPVPALTTRAPEGGPYLERHCPPPACV